MAPEHLLGAESRYAVTVDVYAIGVLLYRMLAGHPPRGELTGSDWLRAITKRPPPLLPATAGGDWEAVVRRCLANDPADRYATADALANDLAAVDARRGGVAMKQNFGGSLAICFPFAPATSHWADS